MDMMTILFGVIGVIGTAAAIYQTALLRANKKHRAELQYLLAGIHQLALSKQVAWNNQLGLLPPIRDEKDLAVARVHTQARDDLMEMSSAISALEGTISTESSAIKAMMEKTLEQVQLNNKLQEEGLKNPSIPKANVTGDPTGASGNEGD